MNIRYDVLSINLHQVKKNCYFIVSNFVDVILESVLGRLLISVISCQFELVRNIVNCFLFRHFVSRKLIGS